MPVTLALNDILEVKVACNNTNQLGLNVLHYRIAAVTGGAVTDADMALAMDVKFAPIYKSLMGNTASYFGVRVQVISTNPKPVAQVSTTLTGAGGIAGGVLPGQVCAIIKKITAIAGRRGRGRYYIPFPPVPADDTTLNKPTAAYLLLLQAAATALDDPITATFGADDAIATLQVRNAASGTVTAVDQLQASPIWATQRRRGNYGQPNVYPPF